MFMWHIIRLCKINIKLNIKKNRSSHQRCSIRKGVLRNFSKFTGKHLCQSLFFNKVAGLRPATLLKKRLWHRCFPVNFEKFLRTPFVQNTSGGCFWKKKDFKKECFNTFYLFMYYLTIWHKRQFTKLKNIRKTEEKICESHQTNESKSNK